MDYKNNFPIFENNPWLVFLDNWASAQKPQSVIDGVSTFVSHDYANIHRWLYELSEKSETKGYCDWIWDKIESCFHWTTR